MEYARLGTSGLKVSRIGLGMMSYGDPALQNWALAEDEAEPIVREAAEAGVTFFDTADMYSDGASEEITGRLLARFSRTATITSWQLRSTTRPEPVPTTGAFPVSTSSPASTPRCGGWGPTISTCTRSTAGMTRLRLRRP
jgi:aryl-alcohol dehydrogenase-like predicted oxidoreductase